MISGCVTVIGPPRASCSRNFGMTLPVLPSTLPKRTAMSAMRDARLQRLAHLLGEPLGRAHDVDRVDRLVGRDQHEALDAVRGRGASRRTCVPSTLFCSAAHAFSFSMSGTCL